MGEFSFKNLSVKLFPDVALAEGAAPVCECCSYEWSCGDCSCTDTPTAPPECSPCTETASDDGCGPCTHSPTEEPECSPCTDGASCGASDDCFPCTEFDPVTADCGDATCLEDTGCHHSIPIVVPPPEDAPAGGPRSADVIKAELALLRTELRQAMGLPPELAEETEVRGKPRTVEEVDRLRDALLGAVAELDEHRTRIEGERSPE